MSHPQAELFWQIPHCQDLQDDKFLTSPGGGGGWARLELTTQAIIINIIWSKFFFLSLAESPPHDLQITAYKYNGLLMHNVVQLCLSLSFGCKKYSAHA